MKKIVSLALSMSLALSVLIFPSSQASASEEVSIKTDMNVYQKMKEAGMTDKDIQRLQRKNAEDLKFLSEGGLERKAQNDQKLLSNVPNNEKSLASSVLGTYGDILVAYNASSWGIDFGYPGHAAIVAIANTRTVESFPEDGVQYHVNDWGNRSNVYAMNVKGATATQYNKAANYAAQQIGKPYNWNFFNPWNEDKFYCSQLVWKAWKTQGIDVDYITIDPIVTPMEIAKSGNTLIYYSN